MNIIPLVNLAKQYQTIKKEVLPQVEKVFLAGNFILGDQVGKFESEFAKYCNVKYCVGVASGTDALLLSLKALDIGPGDEVITPANTFISTILPLIYLGAKPVLVDIDPNTYQIDPKLLEKAVTRKTKAVIPAHLYGIPSPMDQILKIAKKHRLFVLEDACQAHGSSLKNKKCGSFGDLAAFSFYPGKNLGAAGDGGVVATNIKKLADKIKSLRNIGQTKKYEHDLLGYNSRLDTLHAAVLSVKLKKLDSWNKKRNKVAYFYNKYLKDLPIIIPPQFSKDIFANNHLYVIRTPRRDQLISFLKSNGISSGIHYPIPLHLQKSLKYLGFKRGDFKITEKYAKEILSLPMYPELTEKEIIYISSKIREFFQR